MKAAIPGRQARQGEGHAVRRRARQQGDRRIRGGGRSSRRDGSRLSRLPRGYRRPVDGGARGRSGLRDGALSARLFHDAVRPARDGAARPPLARSGDAGRRIERRDGTGGSASGRAGCLGGGRFRRRDIALGGADGAIPARPAGAETVPIRVFLRRRERADARYRRARPAALGPGRPGLRVRARLPCVRARGDRGVCGGRARRTRRRRAQPGRHLGRARGLPRLRDGRPAAGRRRLGRRSRSELARLQQFRLSRAVAPLPVSAGAGRRRPRARPL